MEKIITKDHMQLFIDLWLSVDWYTVIRERYNYDYDDKDYWLKSKLEEIRNKKLWGVKLF